MNIELISKNKSAGGWHKRYRHFSECLRCDMTFAIYLPPQLDIGVKNQKKSVAKEIPVLYWLSGLTCSDENFMQKAGAHAAAAKLGLILVAPDSSPRGEGIPDDELGVYDLGLGAGFYLNATEQPWKANYQMYDYIVAELPKLVEDNFPASKKRAISGHSMGGHGALTIGLKNPQNFTSISAFSPIVNPMNCPWGQKAFAAYLGDNREVWKNYDCCELLVKAAGNSLQLPILIDQGSDDDFMSEQLLTERLIDIVNDIKYPAEVRIKEGYDHSYFFIASFIDEHLRFHSRYLHV